MCIQILRRNTKNVATNNKLILVLENSILTCKCVISFKIILMELPGGKLVVTIKRIITIHVMNLLLCINICKFLWFATQHIFVYINIYHIRVIYIMIDEENK